jgi:hypothetical protein
LHDRKLGRLCSKRELHCPPSHGRRTGQRARRCPPGPVTRPARSPHAPRRPRLRRSTPPRPCARQPAAKPAPNQPRSEGAEPLLYHPRADRAGSGATARVGGVAHMPGKRAAPRREQQGRAVGRTWAHGSSQPSQRSLPAGRSAGARFATVAGCRPILAPRRGPPRPYTHPASARPLRRPGEAVAAPGQRLSLTPATLNQRFCSPTPPKAHHGARMLEHSRPVRVAGRVPRGCAGVRGTRRGGGGRQGGCHRETCSSIEFTVIFNRVPRRSRTPIDLELFP